MGSSTLSRVSSASIRVTLLSRDDWRSAVATAVDAPPGADPSVADALARGRTGRADALLIESYGGAALLPVVRHHRRVGDIVEALPHGLAGGPVSVFGAPPRANAAALCRALGAQRVSVAVHHLQASRHPNCGTARRMYSNWRPAARGLASARAASFGPRHVPGWRFGAATRPICLRC